LPKQADVTDTNNETSMQQTQLASNKNEGESIRKPELVKPTANNDADDDLSRGKDDGSNKRCSTIFMTKLLSKRSSTVVAVPKAFLPAPNDRQRRGCGGWFHCAVGEVK